MFVDNNPITAEVCNALSLEVKLCRMARLTHAGVEHTFPITALHAPHALVDDAQTQRIAFLWSHHSSAVLQSLDLTHNHIGSVGLDAILDALLSGTAMQSVALVVTSASPRSSSKLAQALLNNISLSRFTLGITECDPHTFDVHAVLKALRLNGGLTHVWLSLNMSTNEGEQSRGMEISNRDCLVLSDRQCLRELLNLPNAINTTSTVCFSFLFPSRFKTRFISLGVLRFCLLCKFATRPL